MPVPPPTLTDTERVEGMGHVGYELDQMVRAASLLLPDHVDTADPAEAAKHNAALESALTHGRALIEFMVGDRARPDDIRPEDFYAAGPAWQGPQGADRASLLALQRLLHKHLGRLTWARVRPSQQPGPDLGTGQTRQEIKQIVGHLDVFAIDLSTALAQGRAHPDVVTALRARLLWCRQAMATWRTQAGSPAIPAGTTPTAPATTTSDPFEVAQRRTRH